MKIQVRTILLGLLSIGFVQSYAQTFALQVKNDQITYLNDDRETGFSISLHADINPPNRIFLLSVMWYLYPGKPEIILHVFNVPLIM